MFRRETPEAEKACYPAMRDFFCRGRSGLLPLEQKNRGSRRNIPPVFINKFLFYIYRNFIQGIRHGLYPKWP